MKREKRFFVLACSLAACVAVSGDDGVWQMDIVDELAALATQANPTNTWSATQGGTWKLLEGTADVPYCTGGYTPGSSKYLTGFKSGSGYFTFLANTNTAYVAGLGMVVSTPGKSISIRGITGMTSSCSTPRSSAVPTPWPARCGQLVATATAMACRPH